MGSVKVKDKIIITDALVRNKELLNKIIGKTARIIKIDTHLPSFPYKVQIEDTFYWVEGIPYSSLMMELV